MRIGLQGLAALTVVGGLLYTAGTANAQAGPEAQNFPDVPKSHWAYSAVLELKQKGILLGYPADTRNGEPKTTNVKSVRTVPKVAKAPAKTKRTRS